MRDLATWGTAVAFLLAALYAVTVRREVVALGRSIGELNRCVVEQERRNANLALEVARLRSPGTVTARARDLDVLPEGANGSPDR